MALERWGTLSVRDHLDLEGLAANVVLYDRLVVPVPPDMAETMRWRESGWAPDELNDRLQLLGELAVRRPWDAGRQDAHRRAMAYSQGLDYDLQNVISERSAQDPYRTTRVVLAQEEQFDLPAEATRVDVVAAFNSAEALGREAVIGKPEGREGLALLFQHELAVPDASDPADALRQAIALSTDPAFRDKRRDYYEWQDKILAEGVAPEVAAREMHEMVEAYNRAVEKAVRKVRRKFAFTVGAIALQLTGAAVTMNPLPAVSALLQFISFKALDGKPAVDPGRSRPAAMFHDVKRVFNQS